MPPAPPPTRTPSRSPPSRARELRRGVGRQRLQARVRADGAQQGVGRDRGDLDAGPGARGMDDHAVAEVDRHMRGLGEVDHQVARPQLPQRHLRQLPPLLLARPGDLPPRVRPRLRREPRAVEGTRSLRAPHVRLPDLPDGVLHRLAAQPRRCPPRGLARAAERARGQQTALRLAGVPLLQPRQTGQLFLGQRGQQLLHVPQPLPYRVALLLLLSGERLLLVERVPLPGREFVRPPLAALQPRDRRRPVVGRPLQYVALRQRALRVPGQQQPQVRGEAGPPLVLLACQPARRAPALGERDPGPGQARGHFLDLAQLFLDGLLRRCTSRRPPRPAGTASEAPSAVP